MVVISEMSFQGKSATYKVINQNVTTSALLDMGAKYLVILARFFKSLPQSSQLLKAHMHKVLHQLVELTYVQQVNVT